VEKKYYIGEIVNTQALKGELRIKLYEGYQESFDNFTFFYINGEIKIIEKHRFKKNLAIVKFEGLDDINAAEAYIQEKIYLYKEDIILVMGAYLIDAVIGFEAIADNQSVGKLVDIDLFKTSQGVIEVKNNEGSFMVPLHGNFIEKIDMKNKKIYLKNIDGLDL
jgi:16S rRNA processing protein RimM